MWREIVRYSATIVLVLALLPSTTFGQFGAEGGPGTVTGTGMVTVKQKPMLIRMSIQLQEKGKTVKEALAKLQDRSEAAVLQLQSMSAKRETIVVTDPSLSAEQTDQERQMQRMMMQQLRSRGRAPKALQKPKTVTVSSTLTAEWPVGTKTNEELLVIAQTLQERIETADLAGLKEPKQLTPEEEELQEEMAEMMNQYSSSYGDGQPKPGEPTFVYVARISAEERDKALASAFKKAKAQAQRLATAAGVELGKLSSLTGSTSQSNDSYNYGYDNRYAMQMMMAQGGADRGGEEAMVPQPGMVTFQVMINAAFRLK